MRREAQEIMARLHAQIAIGQAKIRADPIPHLIEAHDELFRVRKMMDDLDYALSGMKRLYADDTLQPMSVEAELQQRITDAQKVIQEYYRSKA